MVWGFSQPIEDNMEEAVSGVKGELATKVYGDDLKTLEEKSAEIAGIMGTVKGVEDLGVFHVLGQPNLNVTVDRDAAARYQINVADVQDAIQTAVGGNALTQVLKDEARYDLTLRYLPQYRNTQEAIENIRLLSPSGERVSLAQLCKISEDDGGSEIYREGNQRYVAIKYSVRGRDLGGTVEEAMKKVNEQVKLPPGYHIDWEGEYESQKRADERLLIVLPITILVIFVILYTMFKSFKWALLILANVAMARFGGLLALLITGTNFSVSSGVGFLALFGVSVQTGVIMLEYINQLRARRFTIEDAAVEGAVLRLRPIMMTMLVATLGLAAGRSLARHRFRFAAAVRHRHRRRTDCGPGDEHLSAADFLRVDCRRAGRAASRRRRGFRSGRARGLGQSKSSDQWSVASASFRRLLEPRGLELRLL